MRPATRMAVILCLSVGAAIPLIGQEIPNWPAPPLWSPPPVSAAGSEEAELSKAGLSTTPLPFVGITPCRLVDTRPAQGFPAAWGAPALLANATRDFDLNSAPHCGGIPANVQAYSLNITVTETLGPGDIRIWPAGSPPLVVSTQNWAAAGVTLANAAIVPAGNAGAITVQVAGSDTHVIIDINGYYSGTVQARVTGTCASGSSIRGIDVNGGVTCETDDGVTGVTAGTGLTGGGSSGSVTLNVNLAGSGAAATVSHSDHDHVGQVWTAPAGVALTVFSATGGIEVHSTDPSGTGWGLRGISDAFAGVGVEGHADSLTGAPIGVFGQSASPNGRGVYGYASAGSGIPAGVSGRSDSPSGRGVYGLALSTIGVNTGVYGSSPSLSGSGVRGLATATSGANYGVLGASNSTEGNGVHGIANATSGVNYGVHGWSVSTAGNGVYGLASATSGTTRGVWGVTESSVGLGVQGSANATSGVNFGVGGESFSPAGYGGYFRNVSGGVALYVFGNASARPIDTNSGAYLSTGGIWTNFSDANGKENFGSVDRGKLLEGILRLPITSWNYKAEGSSQRHIGPMAQDFLTVFGVGSDGRSISTIDPSGIALAAIQELYRILLEKDERIRALTTRLEALEESVE